jgi:hypothetical protein
VQLSLAVRVSLSPSFRERLQYGRVTSILDGSSASRRLSRSNQSRSDIIRWCTTFHRYRDAESRCTAANLHRSRSRQLTSAHLTSARLTRAPTRFIPTVPYHFSFIQQQCNFSRQSPHNAHDAQKIMRCLCKIKATLRSSFATMLTMLQTKDRLPLRQRAAFRIADGHCRYCFTTILSWIRYRSRETFAIP